MDDDIVPERECLANLWKESQRHPQPPFVFPLSIQRDGSVEMHGSWCGFLIGKEIAAEVGVPNADLFWWAEDTEYTHWRIPQAGHPRQHAHNAIVHHDSVRRRESVPTWKYYYETRNMIYLHLHVMRSVGRFPLNFTMLLGRAFMRERSGYLNRMRAIYRGVVDGVRGRLGIRYPVTELHERS
jgi:GT2 family glycosyltransferase